MTAPKQLTTSLERLHRFHAYCARFPSEVSEKAIEEYSQRGESVLDPFCGSGTSLVAGLAHGRKVVGTDIDILAGMLSEIKCSARSPADYRRWRERFSSRLERVFAEIERSWSSSLAPAPGTSFSIGSLMLTLPAFPELNYWFPPSCGLQPSGSRRLPCEPCPYHLPSRCTEATARRAGGKPSAGRYVSAILQRG